MSEVIKETLPEVTLDADCILANRYFSPLKMKSSETKRLRKQLMKAGGGIEVAEKGMVRGSNAYRVNSSIEPFMLRTCLHLPAINLSNVLNHCKIHVHTEDKYCKACRIHITAHRCTKRKIEQFLIQ